MYRLLVFSTLLAFGLGDSIDSPPEVDEDMRKIMQGAETDITKVPYQLHIESKWYLICGASILTPTIAITAAHCVYKSIDDPIFVRAGTSKLRSGGTVHEVRAIMTHPNYNRTTRDYDVGLVFLKTPIKMGSKAKPISIIDKEPTSGSFLISGWGLYHDSIHEYSENLLSATVDYVDRKKCEQDYRDQFQITPKMFCAASPGKDYAGGDRGGPAVQNGKLAGIISLGVGFARPLFPGVYTNLAHPEIREWIRENARV